MEIIQNRLTQIGREGGIALVRAAASLVVVGAKDMGFNIADHLGRTIVYSIWMPRHGTTLAFMLRSCIKAYKDRGIYPGDMFLVNNPHDGALHISDVAVLAPVHYHGELIAWTGCATHHLDVRGMSPGVSSDATDWYQEGIVFRPIKIMERGKLREDIFGLFTDNVRVPRQQGLDLKAQIAANNVAGGKIVELVDRYGMETVKACYDEVINFSEAKTRERIRMIPNGTHEAVEYLDYDKVYTLRCALTVKDGTLTFDFTGTDPQADACVNGALACTVANVHNIVACLLIPDVPANEGCFRPIEVTVPKRTILSCEPPAPCGVASTVAGWKAQALAIEVLSKALTGTADRWRASAGWGSGWTGTWASGLDESGKPYVITFMNSVMQGGGARATKDGFDVANMAGSSNTAIPNIEDTEQRYSFLFLGRGMCRDSGGAGKYRGGLAGETAIKLHDAAGAQFSVGYVGKEVPASGFDGGRPGATSLVALKRESNVNELLKRDVPRFEEIEGKETVLPARNLPVSVGKDDVMYVRCQGGGGFGNPLERDPALVHRDVLEGYVSPHKARTEYKVAISPESLELDAKVTQDLRRG